MSARKADEHVSAMPAGALLEDRDILAALADVERAKKREAELRNKTRTRRLIDTGLEWARLCSLHGLPHLALARSVVTIIIWAIVVTAAFGAFFYLLVDTIMMYLDYATTVQVQLDGTAIPFPSVTVCNNSPYKLSKFQQVPELNAILLLYRSLIKDTATIAATTTTTSPGSTAAINPTAQTSAMG